MFRKYRKHAVVIDEWHFHPECSRWPEMDFVEDDFPYPEEFCLECVKIYSSRAPIPTSRAMHEGHLSFQKSQQRT